MAEALVNWLAEPATLIGLGTVAVFAVYYLISRPSPRKPPIPLDRQSIEIDGRIRMSQFCKNKGLLEYEFEDARTLYEGFKRGLRESNDGPCLGERRGPKGEGPYEFLKYSEILKRAHNFGAGLVNIGVPTGQKSFIGIYSRNCINWVVTSLSCDAYSRVVVPLYDTLGPKAVAFAVNQAEIYVIVCHPDNMKTLTHDLDACGTLKHIITWGNVSEGIKQTCEEHNVELYMFDDIMKQGEQNPVELRPVKPDDISTICYTSGTTGDPKGAKLTHKGLIAVCSAVQKVLGSAYSITKDDCHISFLPLAHSMERTVQAFLFQNGAAIGFFRGDIKLLMDDIQTLKPTIFVAVPRLLNRVYDKVQMGVAGSAIKKTLLNLGLYFKGKELERGIVRKDSIWDKILFGRMQRLLGGRVRFVVTGSAPIAGEVMRFLRVAFGCFVFEGYGQTECHAAATFTLPGETGDGHVGPPLPCVQIKLVDVPEMQYFSENEEGEICFKGPSVFTGYLKNPEKTKEALDDEGWLHSGDVGRWLPNGVLKIIDRKKQIFKTQQGEYIAPEKVENVYLKSLFIQQVFLYGHSLKPCVLAIVVPDEEYLAIWAKNQGLELDREALCSNELLKKTIMKDIKRLGQEAGLKSFEQAKAIYLSAEIFTIENNLLTPTHKLVRRNLEKKFMDEFNKMYDELPK